MKQCGKGCVAFLAFLCTCFVSGLASKWKTQAYCVIQLYIAPNHPMAWWCRDGACAFLLAPDGLCKAGVATTAACCAALSFNQHAVNKVECGASYACAPVHHVQAAAPLLASRCSSGAHLHVAFSSVFWHACQRLEFGCHSNLPQL